MLRSLKTPTLFIILLLAVLSVLTFNYWGLAQNNVRLRDSLISVQNRLNESNDKKANVEKQVNLNTQEIDQLKAEIADKNKALDQKGKDIETLNNKLKEIKQEKDNLLVEVNDVKEKLNKSESEKENQKSKANEYKNSLDGANQQIEKLKAAKAECNIEEKLKKFKSDLATMVELQFNKADAERLKTLMGGLAISDSNEKVATIREEANFTSSGLNKTDSSQVTNFTDELKQLQPQVPQPLVQSADVCTLPKQTGDCPETHERYFFDSSLKKCLVFVYTGCKGNANNFETLDKCNEKCVTKTV